VSVRQLVPTEFVTSHACTDPSLYTPDLDLLAYLLQDLRTLLRSNAAGRVELVAHEPVLWDVHNLRRRTVVCETEAVRSCDLVHIVGFFADRRDQIDDIVLDDLEIDLFDEFRRFPGILSYSSMELANRYWANLVVHRVPDDTESWRTSTAHDRAVDISPRLYRSVRIHNGHIDGGVVGNGAIVIDRTKYWDYDHDPVWRAERSFDPPLRRVRKQHDDER
jgi:hypothetical protein